MARETSLLITRTLMKTPHINGTRFFVPVVLMGRMGWAFNDRDWPRGLPHALRDRIRERLAQGVDSGAVPRSPYWYDYVALQASGGRGSPGLSGWRDTAARAGRSLRHGAAVAGRYAVRGAKVTSRAVVRGARSVGSRVAARARARYCPPCPPCRCGR